MDLSRPPQVGAVISFCYLWRREFEAGLVEGRKRVRVWSSRWSLSEGKALHVHG